MSSNDREDTTWSAVRIHPHDNVAVALADLEMSARVLDQTSSFSVTLRELIPLGHKFALSDIAAGTPVIKYGETIGSAKESILHGAHVHVHNVASLRASPRQ